MIEEILPSNATKLRVVKGIYENPEIKLTELIALARASPNLVVKYVNALTEYGVILEERFGGKEKTHLRLLKPNLSSDIGLTIFSLVEREKRLELLGKYKKLKPIAEQLRELLNGKVEFCLVYGSFARLAATTDSDLDLLIVGNVDKQARVRIAEILTTLDRPYAVEVESIEDFMRMCKTDAVHKSILKEHVALFGERQFLRNLEKLSKKVS